MPLLPVDLAKDFDVRNWNYPTRAAMVSYHHRAREAEVEIGYLLEGKVEWHRMAGIVEYNSI